MDKIRLVLILGIHGLISSLKGEEDSKKINSHIFTTHELIAGWQVGIGTREIKQNQEIKRQITRI